METTLSNTRHGSTLPDTDTTRAHARAAQAVRAAWAIRRWRGDAPSCMARLEQLRAAGLVADDHYFVEFVERVA